MKWNIFCKVKKVLFRLYFGNRIDLGKGLFFKNNFYLTIDKNAKLKIGKNSFFNNGCSINVREKVSIGDNCLFGEGVKIYDHNHIFKYIPEPISQQGFKSKEITIGDNCWIGSNVVILKGVTIGSNCVIAAGTVVKQDVDSNCILDKDKMTRIRAKKR